MNLRGALRHTALPLATLVLAPAATAHAWQAFPGRDSVPANQPVFTLSNEAAVDAPALSLGLVGPSGETPIACDLLTRIDPQGDGSSEYYYALHPQEPLPVGATVAFHFPFYDGPMTAMYAVTDAIALPSGDAVIGRDFIVHLSYDTIVDVESTLTATTLGGDLLAWDDRLEMAVYADDVLVSRAPRHIDSHFVSWNVPIDCSGASPGDTHFVAVGPREIHVRIGGFGATPAIDTRATLDVRCAPTAYVDANDGHTLTAEEVAARLGPQPDAGEVPVHGDAGASTSDGGASQPPGPSGCSATPMRSGSLAWIAALVAAVIARRKR